MAEIKTSLSLTGLSTGMNMTLMGAVGTIVASSDVTAVSGFDLSRRMTGDKKGYDVVTISNQQSAEDPATIAASVLFVTEDSIDELDLEVRFENLPEDSELSVESSVPSLTVSRQSASGSSLVGTSTENVDPSKIEFDLKIWVPHAGELSRASTLTLQLSSIAGGSGGPVKKTLLEKIELNLG